MVPLHEAFHMYCSGRCDQLVEALLPPLTNGLPTIWAKLAHDSTRAGGAS